MLKNFEKESFDIIIQAGQSNSEGTGFGDALKPYVPNENVWYLNSNFTITQAAELVSENQIQSNYSLSFADEYIKNGFLKEGRKLLILRASVGGTGFSDHRWGLTDDLFLRMIDMIRTALELGDTNRLVALLWHQGESDAVSYAPYEIHYNHLISLVKAVRENFHCAELPFIAGDFVEQWKNNNKEICEPVLRAIKDVCANIKNGRFVHSEELLSNSQTYECDDTIHFSRQSLYVLGERYFSAFKQIVSE